MAATNAVQVAADLAKFAPRVAMGLRALVLRHGLLLQTSIMGYASGRPGPNAPTGDYRGSWTTEEGGARASGGGLGVAVTVGTNKPQARRLEYGFVGADILGRVYNQPPFPHVAPAVAKVEPQFQQAMLDLVKEATP